LIIFTLPLFSMKQKHCLSLVGTEQTGGEARYSYDSLFKKKTARP
jgi:hypothetical protein